MRTVILFILLSLSFSVSAELIDQGQFTTDSEQNLDWLDLSETTGLSWNQARGKLTDWRPATLDEIKALHAQLFPGYDPGASKMESLRNGYENQLNDVHAFNALFGFTFQSEMETFSVGLYRKPAGNVTLMGAREVFADKRSPHRTILFGPKYMPYEPYNADFVAAHAGVYMVRPTADTP